MIKRLICWWKGHERTEEHVTGALIFFECECGKYCHIGFNPEYDWINLKKEIVIPLDRMPQYIVPHDWSNN